MAGKIRTAGTWQSQVPLMRRRHGLAPAPSYPRGTGSAGRPLGSTRARWLAAAALGACGVLAWKMVAQSGVRRERVRGGELRELRSIWVQVKGLRMHVRCAAPAAGAAAEVPVILVHGWGISGAYFNPLAERLAAGRPVYVPDLPGHGLSEAPAEPLDIDALAEWLDDWMLALGIERAVLVGHSMGCQIAVEAALRHPERIERLVLIAPTTDPEGRSAPRQFMRFLTSGLFPRPALTWQAARDYWRMGKRLIPEFRAMLQDKLEGKLPLLEVPTLLVRGERDPVAPQRWVDRAAGMIETSSTAVIPGWGHALPYSAAEQLTPVVEAFLRQVPRGA